MPKDEPTEPRPFTVRTEWSGGIRTRNHVRGHEVVVDGPHWRFGTDDGPAPGELMLASVASCFVNHLVRYMQYKRTTLGSVEVETTGRFRFMGEMEVFDTFIFDVTVRAPGRLESVVEKAFKVAQVECTMLSILDVTKEFNLNFVAED